MRKDVLKAALQARALEMNFAGRKSVPPSTRAGAGGAVVYSGYLQTNETKAALTGRQKYKTYSEILANTTIVAAAVRHFLNLVSKASWKMEPADDSAEAQRIAELMEEIIGDMENAWYKVVRRAAGYRFYGFSVQEWIAKRRDDGVIGLLDIEARPQITIERWDLDEGGAVLGVGQRSPQTQQELYIPRSKMLYLVEDSLNDTPEGLGLLRHVAEPARILARFEQLEGFGFETDLRGVPIGRVPFVELNAAVAAGRMSPDERDAMVQVMINFINNHVKSPETGMLMDSVTYQSKDASATPSDVKQWDMDLMKGGNTSQDAVAAAISRKVREIARVLGAEGLLIGETGAGSLAMSKDKSQTFALTCDSALTEITAQVKRDICRPLCLLNGWDIKLCPVPKTEAIQFRDVTEITTALKDLATAGAVMAPDDEAINEIRDLLGLSKIDLKKMAEMAGELMLQQQQAASAPGNPGGGDGAQTPDEAAAAQADQAPVDELNPDQGAKA